MILLKSIFLNTFGRSGSYTWEDHRPPSGVYKGTNGGEVISFSGCDDDQTAADTQVNSQNSFVVSSSLINPNVFSL